MCIGYCRSGCRSASRFFIYKARRRVRPQLQSITAAHASVGAAATLPTTGMILSPADARRHGAATAPQPVIDSATAARMVRRVMVKIIGRHSSRLICHETVGYARDFIAGRDPATDPRGSRFRVSPSRQAKLFRAAGDTRIRVFAPPRIQVPVVVHVEVTTGKPVLV